MIKKLVLLVTASLLMSCTSDNENESSSGSSGKLKRVYTETGTLAKYYYNGSRLDYIITPNFYAGENSYELKSEFIFEDDRIVKIKNYWNGVYQADKDNVFIYTGNYITSATSGILTTEYIYDDDGNIIEEKRFTGNNYNFSKYFTYYPDGNINTIINNGTLVTYTYDTHKKPDYYIYPENFAKIFGHGKNNVLTIQTNESLNIAVYEYNTLDFPTKYEYGSNIIYYEYY